MSDGKHERTRSIIERETPADHFTIIPNALIRDNRLSRFARSCLIEILSNTPDWRNAADDMWRRSRAAQERRGEGRAVYYRAFREMQEAGYLTRTRLQDPDGTWYTLLHFRAEPVTTGNGESSQVAPTIQKPAVGGQAVGSLAVQGEEPRRSTTKEFGSGELGLPTGPRCKQRGHAADTQATILRDVREAIDEWYGSRENLLVENHEALGLWEALRPQDGRAVLSRKGYLMRIFEDTPNIDTLLSKYVGPEDEVG
jgi:hypothetical protein